MQDESFQYKQFFPGKVAMKNKVFYKQQNIKHYITVRNLSTEFFADCSEYIAKLVYLISHKIQT